MNKKDYAKYLKSDHWQTMSRLAREAARGRCQLCDSDKRLNVHHRTYKRCPGQERLSDLTLLCRGCHEKYHAGHDRLPGSDSALRVTDRPLVSVAFRPAAFLSDEDEAERLAIRENLSDNPTSEMLARYRELSRKARAALGAKMAELNFDETSARPCARENEGKNDKASD